MASRLLVNLRSSAMRFHRIGLTVLLALLTSACAAPDREADGAESTPRPGADTATLALPTPLPDPTPDADGKVRLSEAEWRARLTPKQFEVLREAGTERAFTGAYWKTTGQPGTYHCAGCGLALFDAVTKYDSGTGWPSFSVPIERERIVDRTDTSYGMIRTENICARCGGHLGHSFPDSSSPSGLRYCINSLALVFRPSAPVPAGP